MLRFLKRFGFIETFGALWFIAVYAWVYGGRAIGHAPDLRPTTGLGRFSVQPDAAALEFCLALGVLLVLALAPNRPNRIVVAGSIAALLVLAVLYLKYSFVTEAPLFAAAAALAHRYRRAP